LIHSHCCPRIVAANHGNLPLSPFVRLALILDVPRLPLFFVLFVDWFENVKCLRMLKSDDEEDDGC
jgi:hypothetical protein